MTANLLILAGTIEASQLAQAVATKGYRACLSYAGRVERPKAQPIEKRIGGFGGVQTKVQTEIYISVVLIYTKLDFQTS